MRTHFTWRDARQVETSLSRRMAKILLECGVDEEVIDELVAEHAESPRRVRPLSPREKELYLVNGRSTSLS